MDINQKQLDQGDSNNNQLRQISQCFRLFAFDQQVDLLMNYISHYQKSIHKFKEIDDKLLILSDLKLNSYTVIKELKEQRQKQLWMIRDLELSLHHQQGELSKTVKQAEKIKNRS